MKKTTWLKKLITPSPFKIGIVLILICTYICSKYYNTPDHEKQTKFLTDIIYTLHLKSIDKRMVWRGEVPVSDNIILVVADELSLEKFGRWPWPRNIMANIVDALNEFNVKTMSFDIIFSEQEHEIVKNALEEVAKSNTSPLLAKLINKKIIESDKDQVFANSIEKAKDKVILGGYYDPPLYDFFAYQEKCVERMDLLAQEYTGIENQELQMISLDQTEVSLPTEIESIVDRSLQKIAQDIKMENPNATKSDHRSAIDIKSSEFCVNFLVEKNSIKWLASFWPKFQQENADLQSIRFEDWMETYKNSVLENPIERAGRFWVNIPKLSEKSKYFGFFNAFQDSDGYIRKTKLFVRYGLLLSQSLALRTYSVLKQGYPTAYFETDPNNPNSKMFAELRITDPETDNVIDKIPLDGKGNLYINYYGPQMTFPHMSAAELLNGKDTAKIFKRVNGKTQELEVNKKDYLKNKSVFLGATATGIYDLRVTPFQENFPGLETHANILENIMNKHFLLQNHDEPIYMVSFILICGLMFSYAVSILSAVPGFLLAIFTYISIYYVDKYFFFKNGIVICIVIPLFTVLAIYILLTFYKYLTEERKKQELKNTFQKYVSPAIVNEILSNPDKLNLGGRKENMSVLFSDLRGFTTLSEKLAPEVLSDFLNKYLTPMTRLVFKNNGTLDKYMGDAIMAFFGAPVAQKDHAKYACQTALDMITKLHELNDEFTKAKLPNIDIGIGINSGEMSVGNMGSDIVRSYTVMGDSVNLASRLEGINKTYVTRIIISEFTEKAVRGHFTTRELDLVRVKGKLLPVKIYELVGPKIVPEENQKLVQHFEEGFKLYTDRKFELALQEFNNCLNIIPNDGPSLLYIERCQEFLQNPPLDNWDGVYEFKTK